jgi:uncharacterized protein
LRHDAATPPLYAASVPVFRHYLERMSGMVALADEAALAHRLADTFPARQQFATAAGFTLRIACPLAGRELPSLPEALGPRLAVARALLGGMRPEEFRDAETLIITHQAGFSEVSQTGADFLYRFGLPNFFFHLTMGYAALRAAGVPLGKADFDGFHAYPADFRFPGT